MSLSTPPNDGDEELASVQSADGLRAKMVDDDDAEATLSKELLGETFEDELTTDFGESPELFLLLLTIFVPLVLKETLLVIGPDEERSMALLLLILVISRGDVRTFSARMLTKFTLVLGDWEDFEVMPQDPAFIFLETTTDF